MNAFKKIRLTLTSIVSGLCFLGAIGLSVLFILKKTILNSNEVYFVNNHSIFVLFIIFFLFFIGIFVPFIRRIFILLKIEKINPFDFIATILLFIVSFIPILILSSATILLLKSKKLEKHRYKILRISVFILLFLLGVIIKFHGERDTNAQINFENHTSPLDYFLVLLVNGIKPKWNVVAGINLSKNKNIAEKEVTIPAVVDPVLLKDKDTLENNVSDKTDNKKLPKKSLEDKIIAATIGNVVRDYSISVDRTSTPSKISALKKTIRCVENGEVVSVFLEGGRTSMELLLTGLLLKSFDEGDGILRIVYKNKILIQPIVFDFPAIWRGKDDNRFGIHPCIIDIFYLLSIDPRNYSSFEEFKQACWQVMYDQLKESKKIKRFLKNQIAPYNY